MSEIVDPLLLQTAIPRPSTQPQDDYDHLINDLWVGIMLAVMVLSCVGCICSCILYHTFKKWQARVRGERRDFHVEGGYDTESLPSYTVVGGLPSYEEAIEQLTRGTQQPPGTAPSDNVLSKLSVGDLHDIYKKDVKK